MEIDLKAELPKPVPLTLAMFLPEPEPVKSGVTESGPIKPPKHKTVEQAKAAPIEQLNPVVKPEIEPVKEIKPKVDTKPERSKKVVKAKPNKKPNKKLNKKLKKKPNEKIIKKKKPKPKRHLKTKKIKPRVVARRSAENPQRQQVRKSASQARTQTHNAVRQPVRQVRAVRRPVPKKVVAIRKQAGAAMPRAVVNNVQTARAEAAYKARLRQLIATNKRYPQRARRMGRQGIVRVYFVVLANGMIKDIMVKNSSGNSILDKAAMKAVKSISGKLPFPKEIGKKQWVITVPVEYKLR